MITAWSRPITIGIVGGALMFTLGMRRDASARHAVTLAATATELHVPRAETAPKIDGELDEPAWTHGPARTGAFVGVDGATARPFSDARLLHDDAFLYLALYAADEDIRAAKVPTDGPLWTGDSFALVLTRDDGTSHAIDVGPSGAITDARTAHGAATDFAWQSGARAAIDVDGTPDDPRDRDEEWVVEIAIPLASLGLTGRSGERVGFTVRRCDTVDGKRVCGSWGQTPAKGALVLD